MRRQTWAAASERQKLPGGKIGRRPNAELVGDSVTPARAAAEEVDGRVVH
eukprot:CAMPEP_0175276784 /NCGR_PEP_ID=MMETSP0093-20121207/48667_1 /TAXON_ID=311494 /ORGANISM="Alexandrium monilatum, Strain CCMP3105" /LENGTH=49 /DNA_ID= /DNA_START= /DNA_END= /DNA_ORIENTATION=